MTGQPSDAGSYPPSAPTGQGVRLLRRSSDDRVIAGVCGGLGRYVGIDPVIFRIVLAVLAVFGGVGLLLYALAWLFVPEDNAAESEAHRLLQGHATLPVLPAVVVGVLGVLAVIELANHGIGGPITVVVIVAVLAAIVANRRSAVGQTGSGFAAPSATEPQASEPHATGPAAPLGPPAGYSPSRPAWMPPQAPPARPVRQRRPPSILGPVGLSVGVIVAGVLIGLGVSNAANVSAQAIFAAALLTVGLALVLGTWIGRSRGLIAAGTVLTIGLLATAAIDIPLRGGIGTRVDTPATLSELRPSYHVGVGEETLDLRGLDLAGHTAHVEATVGVGQLLVQVPDNVKVVANGSANTGRVVLFGTETTAGHVSRISIAAPTGASNGELDLDLRVGVGQVQVEQFPAAGGGS